MSKKNTQTPSAHPPVWEWIMAAIGAVLIVGAIATAVYRATSTESPAPAFEIEVVSTTRVGSGYTVIFRIKNTSGQTAAAVNIEGKLTRNGSDLETSNAAITYIPAESEREGGFFFTNDPSASQMQIRATGYEKP